MTRTALSWLRQRSSAADDGTRREGEEGFTLVEMLVVITIIGLVMALVGPRVLNYLGESKVKAARSRSRASRPRSTSTISTTGPIRRLAKDWRALVQRPSSAPAWNGPYLKTRSGPRRSMGTSLCLQGARRSRAVRDRFLRRGRGRRHAEHDQERIAIGFGRWSERRGLR